MSRSVSYSSAPCEEEEEIFEKGSSKENSMVIIDHGTNNETAASSVPSPSVVRPNSLAPVSPSLASSSSVYAGGVKETTSSSNSSQHTSLQVTSPHSPIDSLRTWSSNALFYARQYVGEHLGRRGRSTTDPDTSARVAALREQQRQYVRLLRLAVALTGQLEHVVRTQRVLGDALSELSHCGGDVALGEQFSCSADSMKLISKNGESLLASLNTFKQTLCTLCNTTIEDTMATVKSCDAARIKYDAYRLRVEDLRATVGTSRGTSSLAKVREAETAFQVHKKKYERIHGDLIIKLKFLEENKVTVCQKHLYLLQKAFVSYISGNNQGVSDILKHCQFTNVPTVCSDQPEGTVDSVLSSYG